MGWPKAIALAEGARRKMSPGSSQVWAEGAAGDCFLKLASSSILENKKKRRTDTGITSFHWLIVCPVFLSVLCSRCALGCPLTEVRRGTRGWVGHTV